jgi:hypothetical protein
MCPSIAGVGDYSENIFNPDSGLSQKVIYEITYTMRNPADFLNLVAVACEASFAEPGWLTIL